MTAFFLSLRYLQGSPLHERFSLPWASLPYTLICCECIFNEMAKIKQEQGVRPD